MKFFSLTLLMIFFVIPFFDNNAWARNNKTTTDTEKLLSQLVDLPLKKKNQEIKKKLAAVDVMRQGFSPKKNSTTVPPARLTRYREQLLQLQGEHRGEIESMLGGLHTNLHDLKMKFQQETTHKKAREVKVLLNTLTNQIRSEMKIFDEKVIAIDLDFDQRRDEIIRDAKRDHRARRRR